MSARTPRKTFANSPLVRPAGDNRRRLAGRSSDSFLLQQPGSSSSSSPLAASPSTPYHQFAAAQRSRLYPNQPPSSSPFNTAADTSAISLDHEHGSNTSSPAFRKGAVQGFVSGIKPRRTAGPGTLSRNGSSSSPGVPAGSLASEAEKEDGQMVPAPTRQRYLHRKPWSKRLAEWVIDIVNTIYLRYMVDFSFWVLINESSTTLPIALGAFLHATSLFACVILNPSSSVRMPFSEAINDLASPGGAALPSLGSSSKSSGGSLFRQPGGAAGRAGSPSANSKLPHLDKLPENMIPDLRRIARAQAADWYRWTSISLTIGLILVSVAVTYKLFTTTRRYTFWLRTKSDRLRSSRVKLVPLSLDEDVEKPGIVERLQSLALAKLRQVPILGWFLGREEVAVPAGETQMYSLDTWDPPRMLLRLFCIYSPLHAFLWALSSPLFPSTSNAASLSLLSRFFALVLWPALHIAVSVQLYAVVHFFEMLVQDRTLVQSEAMHEYDEKFVLPRAMPMMRDASTMTHQAETIDFARDFQGGITVLPKAAAGMPRSYQSSPNLAARGLPRHTAAASARGEAEADSSFGSEVAASPSVRKRTTAASGSPSRAAAASRRESWHPSSLRNPLPEEEDGEEEMSEPEDEEEEEEVVAAPNPFQRRGEKRTRHVNGSKGKVRNQPVEDEEDGEDEEEEEGEQPVNVFQSRRSAGRRTLGGTR
ncbi:hypothetical protein OC861_003884 [Tilletia horrida]|nr:hypothetical protein OC861_003884 [Tilletia horrida]